MKRCINFLVRNPKTKQLVSGPSISPENTFKTKEGEIATMVMGPTMDHMIIRDLLRNTREAATILQIDETFRKRIDQTLKQLSPTKLTGDGRIMEWTEEFEEAEPGHRHISHLFALHPGKEITRQTPELLLTARKTIDKRLTQGGGGFELNIVWENGVLKSVWVISKLGNALVLRHGEQVIKLDTGVNLEYFFDENLELP